MNSMRGLIGIVLALALAAFAVPGLAQNTKTFVLDAPSSIAAGTQEITFTLYNPPTSNASFNSVSIEGQANVTINRVVSTSSNKRGTVSTLPANKVIITDLSPQKTGDTLTVVLEVTATAPSCSTSTINWTANAWTGSPSSPSNQYNPQTDSTTVNQTCSLTFTSGPTPAYVNQIISNTALTAPGSGTPAATSVSVTVVRNGSAPNTGTTVNLSASCSSGAFTAPAAALTSTTNGSGVAHFPNLKSSTLGTTCTLTASVDSSLSVPSKTSLEFDVRGKLVFGTTTVGSNPEGATSDQAEATKVIVQLIDFDKNVITSFDSTTTLLIGTCTPASGDTTATPLNGIATFSIKFGQISTTTCSMTASTTFNGVPYTTGDVAFTVYPGVLSCTTATFSALDIPAYDPTRSYTFNGSPTGIDYDSETAFLEGARGPGNSKTDSSCTDINYQVLNNIPTGFKAAREDALGNNVPPNGWSVVWDESLAPNPVLGIITTYRSEWGDATTGLPTRQTYVCTQFPCPGSRADYPTKWKLLQACIGTTVERSSVPVGEAACLVRETWTVVPEGDPYYCKDTTPPLPPSGAPVDWKPRCIQPVTITIIGKDPVFER